VLRKRLIFALFYNNGNFMQSRNFRLQRVGDLNWLESNYKFQEISFSLDELIVLNVKRGPKDIGGFASVVKELVEDVFIPVAAGGGIRSLGDADKLFKNGADKIILNSALYETPDLVSEIAGKYGSQSVIASVDYRHVEGTTRAFINDGTQLIDMHLHEYLMKILELPVGEILLNSIDKDGTGFGFDLDTIRSVANFIDIPLVLMGGAGNELHLHEGIELDNISAVASGNLFNFIGNGLPNARRYLLGKGCNLSSWGE
jgi:imidazole glycerol-phosphate synthase subunit HisF